MPLTVQAAYMLSIRGTNAMLRMGHSALVIAIFSVSDVPSSLLSRDQRLDRSQYVWLSQTIGWGGWVDRRGGQGQASMSWPANSFG
jgi:hypothetical protein